MILPLYAGRSTHRCQRVVMFRRKVRNLSPVVARNTVRTVRKIGIISLTFTA